MVRFMNELDNSLLIENIGASSKKLLYMGERGTGMVPPWSSMMSHHAANLVVKQRKKAPVKPVFVVMHSEARKNHGLTFMTNYIKH
jgi:hypothetical protein